MFNSRGEFVTLKTIRYVVGKASISYLIEVPLWHLNSTSVTRLMAFETGGSAFMVCRYVGGT